MMSRLFRARVCWSGQRFQVVYACLAFLWTGSAREVAATELAIQWTAPAGCPDRAEMVSRVERALEDASAPEQLSATGKVTRLPGMYRAQVRVQSSIGSGERVLENTDCEILADSVALVIALSASESEGGAQGVFALSAHGSVAFGPLPEPAFGVGGALALEGLWSLRWELTGTYYAEQSSSYDDANVGADFRMLGFGARGCRVWELGRFDLAPCLGIQLYRIEGEGHGGMLQSSGAAYVWGPALRLFGRLRLLRAFAVFLAADGVVPVVRRSFVYRDLGPLHRPAAFAFQLFLAPEVLF